jgi:hypothetical protein
MWWTGKARRAKCKRECAVRLSTSTASAEQCSAVDGYGAGK